MVVRIIEELCEMFCAFFSRKNIATFYSKFREPRYRRLLLRLRQAQQPLVCLQQWMKMNSRKMIWSIPLRTKVGACSLRMASLCWACTKVLRTFDGVVILAHMDMVCKDGPGVSRYLLHEDTEHPYLPRLKLVRKTHVECASMIQCA